MKTVRCFRLPDALKSLFACFLLAGVPVSSLVRAAEPDLLAPALEGPLKGLEEVLYCVRLAYDDPHWYANIGYYCDDENHKARCGNGGPDAGLLCKLNLRSHEVTVIHDARGGSVRDPQVHYDGNRILFSLRPAGTDFYHLCEINPDGSGLRQLTEGPFDDYEATYLPDGGIAFVSTRCRRWVNCWMTQVGTIHRCDADGSNIRSISANTEHDNTPWVLPDGRLMYTRWEYVDRSQVEFHHLWAMNPDGTGQTILYGNMHPHILMIDAKPVPGTREILANFSPGHGVNEHAGRATLLSLDQGPDEPAAARQLHGGKLVRDPYPLTRDLFLVARDNQLVLLDRAGRMQVLHTHRGPGGVQEPRPIAARPREPVIPVRMKPEESTGVMVLSDVYEGRNMAGVARGDIKKLLILESLPKPVNFSGGPDLTSWLGTFTLERVLGTVPVEADGSAAFEVPAERQVFFVALDENDLSVKRMQSFAAVMPGESLSCVGCHEHRSQAPDNRFARNLLALRRPPSRIEPFAGFPDVLDFRRDVQPILDRHCVECHGYERHEGGVLLGGDLGPHWSHGYFSLLAKEQVADGHNGLGNKPPRTLGSSASALLTKVNGTHHDVEVSEPEWRTMWLWIESGAPYAGSYAGLRNAEEQGLPGAAFGAVFRRGGAVLNRRCVSCHNSTELADGKPKRLPYDPAMRETRRSLVGHPTAEYERIVVPDDPMARYSANILVNFSRPELSPLLLGPLAKEAGGWGSCGGVFQSKEDPGYQAL
ncbi:MAG: PD40 domain-containing protein, partial [Verrucomicrobiae bacterium]|nr:PD40 domain-containing protein [Verrucomicrobiae bacterium]